jgi:hypothetical protein
MFFLVFKYLLVMKSLIRKILREQEEEIITAPPFAFFDYNWNDVLDWADDRLFRMNGDIDLRNSQMETLVGLVEVSGNLVLVNCQNLQSLGNLQSVGGWLDLRLCKNLQSLGKLRSVSGHLDLWQCKNLQSLDELRSVGGNLDLRFCENLQSLGKLESVGGNLYIYNTIVQQYMSKKDIRGKVDVKGNILG